MSRPVSVVVESSHPHRAAERDGWRAGRPVEDPEKTKRWGFITAKPSEYLVHVRRGRVRPQSSGQGASCFKWPGDSVAVVPTSLQQLRFRADQVTLERTGVEITGLAVYRIANPLVAYRVLNFSFPERAQEKLEQTLTAMFAGAVRRIVATLSVDDCLQRRKAMLAEELLREVAPVVGGFGDLDVDAATGWGVAIDTLEIQEVRVLSDQVFSAMQAPYRAGLEQRARAARAEADLISATREAACARAVEEARLKEAMLVAEQKHAFELAQLTQQQVVRERKLVVDAEVKRAEAVNARAIEEATLNEAMEIAVRQQAFALEKLAHARAIAERQLENDASLRRAEADLSLQEAEAALATNTKRREAAQAALELQALEAAVALQQAESTTQRQRLQMQLDADVERERAGIRARDRESEAQVTLARQLPALANALGQKIGEVHITSYGDDAAPFAQLTSAVGAVVDLVRHAAPTAAQSITTKT